MSGSDAIVVRPCRPEDAHGAGFVQHRWPDRARRHLFWSALMANEEAKPWEATAQEFVAEIDGEIVGRVVADGMYPPFGELVNLSVLPPFRRRGVGGILVDACVSHLARRGFMAVFLQTYAATDANALTGQRLYARNRFLPVAKGEMLRLVRFLSLPLLDTFRHEHPLAGFLPAADGRIGHWPIGWTDPVTGHDVQVVLSGGTSDKDSAGYGPGLSHIAMSAATLDFSAEVIGPPKAKCGETVSVRLVLANRASAPLAIAARLLLPPGCHPRGEWESRGPKTEIEPDASFDASFDIQVGPDLQTEILRYANFPSLPLTVEVFAGGTAFWLTHGIVTDDGEHA